MKTLKIGTRGSALALVQARWVAKEIESNNEGVEVELVIIKVQGDRDKHSALNKFAGKGIFTKEIEDALLAGDIDLAVHSLKDLPTELPKGLKLALPPAREDPRDLLVAKVPVMELPEGALVGTGSARRREQLRMLRPDLRFDEIRGNVATRVRKWREGLFDATVLACAGVARLGKEEAGLTDSDAHPLDYSECLPAPGQGILGLEIREEDTAIEEYLRSIICEDTVVSYYAERAFLAELDGGCHIPAGAWGEVKGDQVTVSGFLATDDGTGELRRRRTQVTGPTKEAAELGRQVARALKSPQ